MGRTLLPGSQIKDASVEIADLSASGTPSSSTYLRGDNTWAAPTAAAAAFNPSLYVQSADTMIPTNYSLIVPCEYQITGTSVLTLAGTAILGIA